MNTGCIASSVAQRSGAYEVLCRIVEIFIYSKLLTTSSAPLNFSSLISFPKKNLPIWGGAQY